MTWVAPLLAVAGWALFGALVGPDAWPLLLAWLVGIALIALLARAPGGPRRVGAVGLALVFLALTTLGGLFFLPATLALLSPAGTRAKSRQRPNRHARRRD